MVDILGQCFVLIEWARVFNVPYIDPGRLLPLFTAREDHLHPALWEAPLYRD